MSGTATKIESADLSIEELFQSFYVVPDFQREYVWKPENVRRLLDDVFEEFSGPDGKIAVGPEYFVGSIVVCRDEGARFQLIDGQQRMTTIYVTLCAIRDRLTTLGRALAVLEGQIYASSLNANGEEIPNYRLVLQYEDSHRVLETIARPTSGTLVGNEKAASVRNIRAAYEAATEFLAVNFGTDDVQLSRFLAAFTHRVKLIRIATPTLANALKVFETINDRGVGLDAMDLLKNLLFMKTRGEEYDKLKNRWHELVRTLGDCGEKPLRFLRYYILSHHELDWAKGLREDEIYDWFVKNMAVVGIESSPLGFLDTLVARSKDYANFVRSQGPNGATNRYLRNIAALSGSARQHFVLLMAGHALPPELFDKLCASVENLFFCYLVTREPTKTFDRNFGRWSAELRAVRTADELDAFLAKYVVPDLVSRADRFDFAFAEMRTYNIQQYRLKYVLAKLTQAVDAEAWSNEAASTLEGYLDRSVHIEHILPRSATPESMSTFESTEEYADQVPRLGNLCLLEATINTSIGNGAYSMKQPELGKSAFLLTQSIDAVKSVGASTQFNRAVEGLKSYEVWNAEAVKDRQSILGRLARKVWGIDSAVARQRAGDAG